MNLINNLNDFIGKEDIKRNLRVYIHSCKVQGKSFEHCLFYGLPGTGKTTLAKIIANELESKIRIAQGSTIQKPIDVINLFLSLNDNEILFIDEVHCVNKQCFELFYSAMEGGYIDLVVGKDFNSKVTRIKLPDFTLITATTSLGKIPQPFEDRFGIIINLSQYSNDEIKKIIEFYANKLELNLSNDEILYLIENSKGIPRIVYKLLRRIKDFRLLDNHTSIQTILKRIGIFYKGLDNNDLAYLKLLSKHRNGLGLKTISQILNIDEETIIYKIEPYLFQQEYVVKTSKGRKITDKWLDIANKEQFNI